MVGFGLPCSRSIRAPPISHSVIGNTGDFGSPISGSSPDGKAAAARLVTERGCEWTAIRDGPC
jgi:hypothetical protein